jgi:hypothetical protein
LKLKRVNRYWNGLAKDVPRFRQPLRVVYSNTERGVQSKRFKVSRMILRYFEE